MSFVLEQPWASDEALSEALDDKAVQALLGHALAKGELDDIRGDLSRFKQSVDTNPDLASALETENTPKSVVLQLIDDLVADDANPISVTLVKWAVISHTDSYSQKLQEYLNIASVLRSRLLAEVVVAQDLSQEQEERLKKELSRIYGVEIDLQVRVDPEIVGGIRIHIDGDLIDGSLSGRFAEALRLLKEYRDDYRG